MTITTKLEPGLELDVAIVGAGVSGLYAGYRILSSKAKHLPKKPKTAIFELSGRIGGRLETVFFPGLPDVGAEFGGMRYTSEHVLVSSLVKQLGLTEVDFPMGDKHNLWYIRGARLTKRDFEANGAIPYQLQAGELGETPASLLFKVLKKIMADNKVKVMPTTRAEWDDLKPKLKVGNVPLHQVGWWNVLAHYLSAEAVHFLTDGLGYYTLTDNWNAAEALEFIALDFDPNLKYKTLKEGFDAIPIALSKAYSDDLKGTIYLQQRVQRVERAHFPHSGQVLHVQGPDGNVVEVRAKHVILALPRRSLQMMDQAGTGISLATGENPAFQGLVDSVDPQAALKLFMAFPEPWWKADELSSGRSITDLPIRQCYYFGTEAGDPPRSLLMASYDDDRTTLFWRALGWRPDQQARAPKYPARGQGDDANVYAAPPEMVRHARMQLSEIHDLAVPEPYAAAYRDWTEDPYGAAWHLWRVGEASWDVMPAIRKPSSKDSVYICGEAWSGLQGWVEGALTTTEHVLRDILGLEAPTWLEKKDYYLGY